MTLFLENSLGKSNDLGVLGGSQKRKKTKSDFDHFWFRAGPVRAI